MENLKLKIRKYENGDGTTYIKGSFSPIRIDNLDTNKLVAEINDFIYDDEPSNLDEQLARRIVACVNAFDGISTEDIEKHIK